MLPETTISEDTIYKGKILDLSLRKVQLKNGATASREIITNNGAVAIVPITTQNEVRLVRQYRAAAQKWVLEIPAGGLEPDEDPDQAAPRELLEETGDRAATWKKLHGTYSAPGVLTEFIHLYLATDLTPGPNNLEFDEHIEVVTIPWSKAIDMVRQHEIEDAKTIAGLLSAGLYLGWLAEVKNEGGDAEVPA
jgi:ADP-ribose pyrophosphatase